MFGVFSEWHQPLRHCYTLQLPETALLDPPSVVEPGRKENHPIVVEGARTAVPFSLVETHPQGKTGNAVCVYGYAMV